MSSAPGTSSMPHRGGRTTARDRSHGRRLSVPRVESSGQPLVASRAQRCWPSRSCPRPGPRTACGSGPAASWSPASTGSTSPPLPRTCPGARGRRAARRCRATPPTPERHARCARSCWWASAPDMQPTCGGRGPRWPGRRAATRQWRPPWRPRLPATAARRLPPTPSQAFVEGLLLASFTLSWRTGGPDKPPVRSVTLCGADGHASAIRRGVLVGRAGWQAREVATWPSRDKTPAWLADRAVSAARPGGPVLPPVWDERELAAGGFGGIVGVGKGSVRPPRLVQLGYRPDGPDASRGRGRPPHVVLVGKGITFDSGGLSLKPADGMVTMKRDVTGAAVVLAVLGALRALDVRVRVTGLLAAAENAIGAAAQRPGDVVRHPGGRTSEVANTDAEGRLVLADGLAYAAATLQPDVLVDVATLTGAVQGGARAHSRRPVRRRRRPGRCAAGCRAAGGRAAVAAPSRRRLPARHRLGRGRRAQHGRCHRHAGRRVDHGRAVPATLRRAASRGRTSTCPASATRPDADVWTEGPTGFGARALLAWLTGPDPLAGVNSEWRRPGR